MPEPSLTLDTFRTEIRAANGELELRLRDYIDKKVAPVTDAQEAFSRGEFTKAQESALMDVVDTRLDKRATAGFTRRQWKIALAGVCVSVVSTISGLAIAVSTLLHARGGK